MAKQPQIKKNTVIIIAVILSIFLYLAGVFSGLYANKIIEKKTQADIESLKVETSKNIETIKSQTKEDISVMRNYVGFLDANLRSLQLDQLFLETLNESKKCNFSTITMNTMLEQLGLYWQKLPFRIEEYEQNHKLTSEYLELKKQYIQLSIRAWIISKNKNDICGTNLIPILYFYSVNCKECVHQGEELDALKEIAAAYDKKIIVFTIDFDSDDLMVKNLKEFYNISSAPALTIKENVYQGKLFNNSELLEAVR